MFPAEDDDITVLLINTDLDLNVLLPANNEGGGSLYHIERHGGRNIDQGLV